MPAKSKTAPVSNAPLENYLSRQTAAAVIGVSPQTIDKHIREGRLRAHRVGRLVLISPSDMRRFVEGE